MKISFENYPILQSLSKGQFSQFSVFEPDAPAIEELKLRMAIEFKQHVKEFKSDINVLRDTFVDSAFQAQMKLLGLLEDILGNETADLVVKGTFVAKDCVYFLDYTAKKGTDRLDQTFFMFSRQGIPLAVHNISDEFDEVRWVSQYYQQISGGFKTEQERFWLVNEVGRLLIFSMFKTYAEVETKFLRPKEKTNDIYCRYTNNTDLNFTILDSKWFNNLVRSEGFKVRGHFRFQPYGKDSSERKLIWINDFEKEGYTSRAGKERASS